MGWRQAGLTPVPAHLGGRRAEGFHCVEDGGRGLLLWATRRDGEGTRDEGMSSRWGRQSPGCEWGWRLGLLGAPASFSGSVSTLRFLEPPEGKKNNANTHHPRGKCFLHLPTHHLAGICPRVCPPTSRPPVGPPFHTPWPRRQVAGEGKPRSAGWEAALSTRPCWAAPWASVDTLGTLRGEPPWQGRPLQPGPH